MRKANKQGVSGIIAYEYKNRFKTIKRTVMQVSCFLIMIYMIDSKQVRDAAAGKNI